MNKEFIPYEEALLMKELGFNEKCLAVYQYPSQSLVRVDVNSNGITNSILVNFVSAPLWQQAFRWFRGEYKLNGLLNHYPNTKLWDCSVHNLKWSGKELVEYLRKEDRSEKYSTYEEAQLECLRKLIELVKSK